MVREATTNCASLLIGILIDEEGLKYPITIISINHENTKYRFNEYLTAVCKRIAQSSAVESFKAQQFYSGELIQFDLLLFCHVIKIWDVDVSFASSSPLSSNSSPKCIQMNGSFLARLMELLTKMSQQNTMFTPTPRSLCFGKILICLSSIVRRDKCKIWWLS